ncbi:hypothetical protein N0V93_007762 [Gnomoniopsis smithogilvyi]|uniref:Zn(2)-C6 fungal-type domain-containing protein n=1 Tax=Gnomoniopsis smithogilvyi TaxID=1191159 RepID=A0A9W8YMX5_9PEZI|nr:hypothetical protein N0V93_007762 [Gnomoniopsis smithogilvyi]
MHPSISQPALQTHPGPEEAPQPAPIKRKSRSRADSANQKRRCVSTACIACRKRKSKCDGALPSCAACSSVYETECIYDPNSDHRRKGVYREKIDSSKARNSTLQILIEAILNAAEDDVPEIVRRIRTCDSLDTVAEALLKEETTNGEDNDAINDEDTKDQPVEGERDLARKMGELRMRNGVVRFIGGTSHLIHEGDENVTPTEVDSADTQVDGDPITSWSDVTKDRQLVIHLLNMYWNWHYPFFTTLSRRMFWKDFMKGKPSSTPKVSFFCSAPLVNAMLALGCHFTDISGAFAMPGDSRTKGDHFFAEAKKLVFDHDEYATPSLTTTQALALMSVREAGCGREARGWVYSGMSFRMAQDVGLNLDSGLVTGDKGQMSDDEVDARRITFWGCFLFDKTWSNYLGRLPQLPKNSYNVSKYEVHPDEDSESWAPYTDSGFDQSLSQPSRTRAVGLQLSKLCEISSDLLLFFYHPKHIGRSSGKAVELKKLSELHRQLEDWRKDLAPEFEPKEGQLPNVILMHMFYHLQYIHLFRPFLKYRPSTSPLPPHVSPRRICTANAGFISKLMRLYKKLYNLRQICNIAVYMLHSACTIHLLNLPEKTAKRDIIHGVKHLEEMAEDWPCARRSLSIISVLARKWNCELPEEASAVLKRTDEKYGHLVTTDVPSPNKAALSPPSVSSSPIMVHNQDLNGKGSNISHQVDTKMDAGLMTNIGSMPPSMQSLEASANIPTHNASSNTSMSFPPTSSWAMPGIGQPAMPRSYQTYTSNTQTPQQHTSNIGPAVGGSGQSSWTPNAQYALDGKDWYLKDGVNWQQNFETWGMSASPTSQTSGGNLPAAGGDLTGGGEMFMFKGLQESELDLGDGWDFDSSMANLDMIPGLD